MGAIEDTDSIFVPVLPLLEAEAESAGDIALEEAKGEEQDVNGSVGGGGGGAVTNTPEGGVVVTLSGAADEGTAGGRCLQSADANAFLAEERRSMRAKCDDISQAFPSDGSIVTAANCVVVVTLTHIKNVAISLWGRYGPAKKTCLPTNQSTK